MNGFAKIFLAVFGLLLVTFKQVCGISKKDNRKQELLTWAILIIVALIILAFGSKLFPVVFGGAG